MCNSKSKIIKITFFRQITYHNYAIKELNLTRRVCLAYANCGLIRPVINTEK